MNTTKDGLTKSNKIIEVTLPNGQGVKYFYMPDDDNQWTKFARWELVNCGCQAYARERSSLLPEIHAILKSGSLTEVTDKTSIVHTNKISFKL